MGLCGQMCCWAEAGCQAQCGGPKCGVPSVSLHLSITLKKFMCKCLHVILLCSYLLVEADIEFAIRKPRWMNKWVRDNLSQCPSLSLSLLVPLPLCCIFLYHSPPPSAPPKFLVYRSTPNGRWVRGSLETKMIKEILDLWVGGRWGARHHSHLSLLFSKSCLTLLWPHGL